MKLALWLTATLWLLICVSSRITVEVFYESLCPYCRRFISEQLSPMMKTDLAPEVELKLYPYGNVKLRSDGTYQCQHGEKECTLNAIQACVLYYYKDLRAISFISCNERSIDEVNTCAKRYLGSNGLETIKRCENSAVHGLTTVPWVVINGKRSGPAVRNLATAVCKAIQGEKPQACLQKEVKDFLEESHMTVCYRNKTST